MVIFYIGVAFLCLTALISYINIRFLKLPTTIGVMAISIVVSLIIVLAKHFGFSALFDYEKAFLEQIDFSKVLMDVMLSMLIFAGALHVKLEDLQQEKQRVMLYAIVGTVLSTVIVAALTYYFLQWIGHPLAWAWCFLFGALISPTDPIAVMGILQKVGAPKMISTVISGESLFNDGIGVVLFTFFLQMLDYGSVPTFHEAMTLFLVQAAGGIVYGWLLGKFGFMLLKSIDSYGTEVMITLALALGGYTLAEIIGVSGPLSMVVAGLIIGNQGREYAMSEVTRKHVDMFWEMLDEILNAMLFVLLGLEIVMIDIDLPIVYAALIAIVICLVARALSVSVLAMIINQRLHLPNKTWQILVWGGLRGGISVALVLSLPAGEERNFLLAMTYATVLFSILVQGMTLGKLTKHITQPDIPNLK